MSDEPEKLAKLDFGRHDQPGLHLLPDLYEDEDDYDEIAELFARANEMPGPEGDGIQRRNYWFIERRTLNTISEMDTDAVSLQKN